MVFTKVSIGLIYGMNPHSMYASVVSKQQEVFFDLFWLSLL